MGTEKLNQWLTVIIKIVSILTIVTLLIFLLFNLNTGRYTLVVHETAKWVIDSRTGDVYWFNKGLDMPEPLNKDTAGFHKVNYINGFRTFAEYNTNPQVIERRLKMWSKEKRVSDSIRVSDSLAMVQAERDRVYDSIAKVQGDARRVEKMKRKGR